MGKMTTHEERIAELRARLSGQVPSRTSRKSTRAVSTLSNPMLAGALHAAARDANGAKLSPLEERMVRMLKIFATNEEVAEYGKVYVEAKAKSQAGKGTLSGTIFSGVSLNMDESTAYTNDDMITDAKAMAGDFLAMPENKIIDITSIDTECADNSEYMEALTGAGSGITVFNAPKTGEEESEPIQDEIEGQDSITANSPKLNAITNAMGTYKLTLQRFKCHRKQSDSITGPRNEIYWAVASGSDGRDKINFKTGEYGSIETGSERQMGQTYFNGSVQDHFAGHIECWEADDSGSSFYNKLVQTMKDVSDFAIDAAVAANESSDWGDTSGNTGSAVAILALVGICGRLVAALLEWLTNDDDLVYKREIAFTRSALSAWRQRPNSEMSFMFDGGNEGKHELWIKCEQIPTFDYTLIGWKYKDNTRWAAPSVAGKSSEGITMTDFKNQLFGVFREMDGVYYWTKLTSHNGRWTSPARISSGIIRSTSRPALATFGDRLFCLYTHHQNKKVYCISTGDGSSWTNPVEAAGYEAATREAPALCGYKDRLIAVHRGEDGRLYWNESQNGNTWTTPARVSSSIYSLNSPALTVYRELVYCAIRTQEEKLLVCTFNGSSWNNFNNLGDVMSSAPQLGIASTGALKVFWLSKPESMVKHRAINANGQWEYTIPWSNVFLTGSPGLGHWDGVLWVYGGIARM